jgi:hypothetical protein
VALALERGYVRCLQAFGAFGNIELNGLPFVERPVPIPLNRGEMYKYILARLALDEPESLTGIEPLYCSLFFHLVPFTF